MIVVHLAEYASGGVSTYLKNLINAQIKESSITKIYLIVSKYNSDPSLLAMRNQKLIIISYKYHRSMKGIWKILTLTKIVNEINPDILHLHSSFAGMIRLKLLWSSLKKRTIYCAHGWSFNRDISRTRKFILKMIEAFLSLGCAKIVNISVFEDESSNFLSNNKRVMIYNSIPNKRIVENDNKEILQRKQIRLLFVGRLDEQKGIDLLLNAISTPKFKRIFDLTVIGDNIIGTFFKTFDRENIHFVGWKNSQYISEALQNSDVLVIPSRWEGFGLVSLEAMRAQKMVIASDAGALPEIVENEVTGLIFESGSANSLSKVLLRLSEYSNEVIKNMGIKGYERYNSTFNYKIMISKIMTVYKQVGRSSVN
ncbi:glycosyltransferase [Lactiplantibacillus plantarum]|uniref:glycosyltransferase n=1 Tax=Lactiplantibacillus plantarum TaxID=1590 RepID=UPI0020C10F1F|nr:glycosyltransferase [Lactiplantibacillus plantarum]